MYYYWCLFPMGKFVVTALHEIEHGTESHSCNAIYPNVPHFFSLTTGKLSCKREQIYYNFISVLSVFKIPSQNTALSDLVSIRHIHLISKFASICYYRTNLWVDHCLRGQLSLQIIEILPIQILSLFPWEKLKLTVMIPNLSFLYRCE